MHVFFCAYCSEPGVADASEGSLGEGIDKLSASPHTLGNLAITPAINDLPAPLVQLATGFSISFNFGALSAALDSVEPLVQALGGQLIRVDVFSLLNNVVADGGAAAGLSNVTDPCLTYGVKGNFMCNNPNEYLFWDDAHPTRAGHGVLVEEIANILAAP